jgi:hypothetical protein
MSRYWRLKIEGGAFLFSLALAKTGSVGATKLSGRLGNERMGTARSLSSGRALRGPVGAFARPTLARSLAPRDTKLSSVPLNKVGRHQCEHQGETEGKGCSDKPNQTRQFSVLHSLILIAEQCKTERAHASKIPFD